MKVIEVMGRRQNVGLNAQGRPMFQFRRWNIEGMELQKVEVRGRNKTIEIDLNNVVLDYEDSRIEVEFPEREFGEKEQLEIKVFFYYPPFKRQYTYEIYVTNKIMKGGN